MRGDLNPAIVHYELMMNQESQVTAPQTPYLVGGGEYLVHMWVLLRHTYAHHHTQIIIKSILQFNVIISDYGYMGGYNQAPMPNPAQLGSMLQQPIVQVI